MIPKAEPRETGNLLENVPEEMRRRPALGVLRGIAAVKDAVPIETAANDLGADLRPSGEDLRGKGICHGGDNETALLVDPARGRWHCFRCSEGGDVVDLVRAVEGGELWEAVVSLSIRYGVDLPPRQRGWTERQPERNRVREAAISQAARVIQRRLTRVYRPLVIQGGESPEEELAALEELALALAPVARQWAERRVQRAA